jgi:hypothetical protein
MGADEAVGEEPVDRFAMPRRAGPSKAPRRAPRPPPGTAAGRRPPARARATGSPTPAPLPRPAPASKRSPRRSGLRRLPAAAHRHQPRLYRRQPGRPHPVHRRGAGARRGPAGAALRRALGPAARPHAGSHRPVAQRRGPGGRGAHHQRHLLAPARQPQADRGRDADVHALRGAHHRAGEPRSHRVPRRHPGKPPARHHRGHLAPARQMAKLCAGRPHHPGAAHAPPGLPAAPAGPEAPRLARFPRAEEGAGQAA